MEVACESADVQEQQFVFTSASQKMRRRSITEQWRGEWDYAGFSREAFVFTLVEVAGKAAGPSRTGLNCGSRRRFELKGLYFFGLTGEDYAKRTETHHLVCYGSGELGLEEDAIEDGVGEGTEGLGE